MIWIVALGPGFQPLFAQESIPQTILTSQAELTAQQKAEVDAFVSAQARKLTSEDPAEVAEGRARLTEQFLSTSSYFLDYYRQSIAEQVVPLIKEDSPLMTRLNVAIISAKLTGDSLIAVLENGAADPSPAVRYWVAKAVGAVAKDKGFTSQTQQQAVLKVLSDRLKAEDESLVLEQVMVAISAIDLPEAVDTVLAGLDSRVGFHLSNPNAFFKPVYGGMQQLYRKLVAQRAAGERVDAQLYELARTAYRYYALIARQMDGLNNNGSDKEDLRQDKAMMASLCGQVMAFAAGDVAGLSIPQPVNTSNAAQLKASAALWHDIFRGAPFNYSEEQLALE
ncbi:MAG: hypothetical protein Kow00105_09370 [Phycisphaeraceae bacterium]